MESTSPERVKRISISLPSDTYQSLDRLVDNRGFQSRSQAITEMIHQSLAEFNEDQGDQIMAGSITLVFDETRIGLMQNLAEIQRHYLSEIQSSQTLLLKDKHRMEILMVEGPAKMLKRLADQLISCKGVRFAKLTTTGPIPRAEPWPLANGAR